MIVCCSAFLVLVSPSFHSFCVNAVLRPWLWIYFEFALQNVKLFSRNRWTSKDFEFLHNSSFSKYEFHVLHACICSFYFFFIFLLSYIQTILKGGFMWHCHDCMIGFLCLFFFYFSFSFCLMLYIKFLSVCQEPS